MRTRSQNVSPGGFVSLPPPSRKRRTQRRASPSSESDNKKSSSKKGRKARNGSAAGEGAAPPVAQLAQGGDVPPEENLSRQRRSATDDGSPTIMRAGKKRSRDEAVDSDDQSIQSSPTKRFETSCLSREPYRLNADTEEAFLRHRRRRRLASENGQYYVDRIVTRGKVREAQDAAERAAIRLGGAGSPRDPLARHAVLDASEISSDEENDIIMTLPRDQVKSKTTISTTNRALRSSWGFRSLLGYFFNFMPKIPSVTFGRSGGRTNVTTAPPVGPRTSEVRAPALSSRSLSSGSESSKESQSDASVHDDWAALNAASPVRNPPVNKGGANLDDVQDAVPDEMENVQGAVPLEKEDMQNTAASKEMESVQGAVIEENPATPVAGASSSDRSVKKRKRAPSPDTIPNPPGCSYGMDLDYFYFDTSDEEEAARIASAQASTRASPQAPASETPKSITPKKKKKKVSTPGSSAASAKRKKLFDAQDEGEAKTILKTPSQSKVKSPEKKRKEVRWAEDVVSPKSRYEGSSSRQPATAPYAGGQFSGVDDPFTSEARPESRRPASVTQETQLDEKETSNLARPAAPSTSTPVSDAESADKLRPSFASASPSGQFRTTPSTPPQGRPGFEAYQVKVPSSLRESHEPGIDTGIAFESSRTRPAHDESAAPASRVSDAPVSDVSAVSGPPSSSTPSTSRKPAQQDGPSDEELRRIFGDDEDGREAFDIYKRCPSGELENMIYPDPSPVSSRLSGVDLSLPCDEDTAFAPFNEAFEAFEAGLPCESPARMGKGKQPILAA